MARKSRKNTDAVIEAPVQISNYFPTATYVRLSIENSGKDDDGDSIANQISFCKAYLAEHTDLKLYDIYEDNGEKGTNFDRPEFKRMMDDIRGGKVKCVLVKDLSRFGRDYIEAGEYLEKIFPFMGIRFISITDGYDSLNCDDAESALMIPLKNMINDVYAKDISRKIITSFRARQEKGEFLPAFAPYGYVKSKEVAYRYEIDQETAPYVRMIFEWKAEGVSHNEICKRLNDMGAVTPARRKVDLGIWRAEKYKHTVWHGRTIIDIMKNPTYTGCIVYGRIPKSLYEGIKMHRAPEEEWRYVPDAHEPIISQELFDKVQKMFADRAEKFKAKMDENAPLRELVTNHFKGKIYCGDCGKRMRFVKPTDKRYPVDQDHAVYVCGGYLDSGYSRCSRHSIRYPVVADAVLAAINMQLELALKQEQLIRQMRGSVREKSLIDKYVGQINYLSQERKKINNKRESLFENFAEGILDEAEYQFAKKKYDDEAAEIERKLTVEKAKKVQLDDILSLSNEWLEAIHKAENITEIDAGLVKHLVSSVKIFEDNRVEVELNFGDQRNIFNRIIAEMAGEANE
ncbi:recombinase family protein [Faecalicatena contorta]|uniref:recombinase family protein n=1 Tax=Faecalicatena contorta TaxID=39482 RepID=UPI001F222A4F|nr:recombinase family protein [Faecalicatena contorta]MCF2682426.1 recombinase family protein [Faecalicatena contorta]